MNEILVPIRTKTPEAVEYMLKALQGESMPKQGALLIILDRCSVEFIDCATCPCPARCRNLYAQILDKELEKESKGKYK